MELAATASALNVQVDLTPLLVGDDPAYALMVYMVTTKTAKIRGNLAEDQAVRIANSVGKLFK